MNNESEETIETTEENINIGPAITSNDNVELLDFDDLPETEQKQDSIQITPEDVIKATEEPTNKIEQPRVISPEDVLQEINKTQPKMISPEDVLEQVGTKTVQESKTPSTTTNEITSENVQVKESTPIKKISDAETKIELAPTKPMNTPAPTSIVLPSIMYDDEEENELPKKKNKLILIIPIIIVLLGAILFVYKDKIFEGTKEHNTKTEKLQGTTIENDNGNAYFYAPIKNEVETGTSDDTTYYILGEEKSGQEELYEQLIQKYKKESSYNLFDGNKEKSSEIGPIKENNIWIVLPLVYEKLNNRIIKSNVKDGSIIVISTSKGITSKVEEHLRLMNQLGAAKTLIFINNDNDSEDNTSIIKNVKTILKNSGYDEKNTPIVEGKVKDNESIEKLYQKMNEWIDIVRSSKEEPLKAHITNVQREGKNTSLIEVELEKGTIKPGDKIELICENKKKEVTVQGIYVNNESRKKVDSTENINNIFVSINEKYNDELKSASLAIAKDSIDFHEKYKAIFYYEKSEYSQISEEFGNGYQTNIQLQRNIKGTIRIPSNVKFIAINDTTNITVNLKEAIPMYKGQQFTINDPTTGVFGYGQITEIIK